MTEEVKDSLKNTLSRSRFKLAGHVKKGDGKQTNRVYVRKGGEVNRDVRTACIKKDLEWVGEEWMATAKDGGIGDC